MVGTLGSQARYCLWHWDGLQGHAETRDNREEFERWRIMLTQQRYCSEWVHAPSDWLWALLRGEAPGGEPHRVGCRRGFPSCAHAVGSDP